MSFALGVIIGMFLAAVTAFLFTSHQSDDDWWD
jgi:fucose permease